MLFLDYMASLRVYEKNQHINFDGDNDRISVTIMKLNNKAYKNVLLFSFVF